MRLTRTRHPKVLGTSGQATIEFALALVLLLGFTFFFIQLAMVFAWGNYVQYATFMSARAYQSAGFDRADQEERAKAVIVQTVKKGSAMSGVDRFPGLARAVGGGTPPGFSAAQHEKFVKTERNFSWLEGVRYKFRSRVFPVPLGRSTQEPGVNQVTLTSEAWLGREPSYAECMTYMQAVGGFIDNGC